MSDQESGSLYAPMSDDYSPDDREDWADDEPDTPEGELEYSQAAQDTINDCLLNYDLEPTPERIHLVFDKLTPMIKNLVHNWGWGDTEVGDYICLLIEKEKIN